MRTSSPRWEEEKRVANERIEDRLLRSQISTSAPPSPEPAICSAALSPLHVFTKSVGRSPRPELAPVTMTRRTRMHPGSSGFHPSALRALKPIFVYPGATARSIAESIAAPITLPA
jgi:hypothetical protein